MKYLSLFIVLLAGHFAMAQDSEYTRFAEEVKFYNLYVRGKIDTLKVDGANQEKFRARLDEVFREFVLHPESHRFSRFIQSRSEPSLRFVNGNNMFEIEIDSLHSGDRFWLVYGYSFSEKKNYMVKNPLTNQIVYEGNSMTNDIQLIGQLDSVHYVVVEENGDVHAAREAFVVKMQDGKWKRVKGFEGKAIGQNPRDFSALVYVQRRERLQLEYRFDQLMMYPLNVNDVLFDRTTKTLSYHILLEDRRTKTVSAQWKNNVFILDDYFPDVSGDGVAVPDR